MTELERALGRSALIELSRIVGGRELYVPTALDRRDAEVARRRFAALVGVPFAETLITLFPGQRIYVPKGANVSNNSKVRPVSLDDVAALSSLGMTANQIAERLNCSTRTVHAKRSIIAKEQRS